MSAFESSGDAKAISRVAQARYGGFEPMFEQHGWTERGSDMMRKGQTRMNASYWSVVNFVAHYEGRDDDR